MNSQQNIKGVKTDATSERLIEQDFQLVTLTIINRP